ncbi:MAG: hypothetical protein IJC17_04470 [Clostridia bacterium]|nr:hypothetical protein [Clostridia bacterium]
MDSEKPKKSGTGLLITQCVVTAVLLAVALGVRLIGGPLYDEWRQAWNQSMADNRWIDMAVSAVLGEPDGTSTEVTP